MAIRVALHHRTTYDYDRPAILGPQTVQLRPAPHCRTPILTYAMSVDHGDVGTAPFINWQQDPQANHLARLVFPDPVRRFGVTVDLVAELTPINPFDFFLEDYAENYGFSYEAELKKDLAPYLATADAPTCGPLFEAYLAGIDRTPRAVNDFLVDVNGGLQQHLTYSLRFDPGIQTPEETLQKNVGSCRDYAWLLVQLMRRLGLAARFVSGYSIQLVADYKPLEEGAAAGVGQDVTDLHAWTEVFLPGAGWVGLDPTSGMMCGEGHIPLACAPNPTAAAPIQGGLSPCEVSFDYAMSITRVHEDPRVTKPIADDPWSAVTALGDQVDAELVDEGVKLTMGGEPTFVAADDPEGDAWNTTALGDGKRERALKLIKDLWPKFAPGGWLHTGQGKWYPGEPLPRWSLSLFWRTDGQTVWQNPDLLADEADDHGHTVDTGDAFINALAARLKLPDGYARALHEDAAHFRRERDRLPVNVDPTEGDTHLARLLAHGLENPVAHVLPLTKKQRDGQRVWRTGRWLLREDDKAEDHDDPDVPRDVPATDPDADRDAQHAVPVVLIPGDSPAGLRLPLGRLPWVAEKDVPYEPPADPVASADEPLADPNADPARGEAENRVPETKESAPWVVRAALVVEARKGTLHVFLPPLRKADDHLELLAAIEQVAAAQNTPVIIEGYTPPHDARLREFKLTPDPGVLEVNVHPTRTWTELTHLTETLYDAARRVGLSTEKFQLDGRHTGTGGGNHVVVGGATPLDSPFLRRPDLLRSLLAHWLRHPSLSYLFSGMFVGPTSQAPRVDEGRPDAVYELEIAFAHTPDNDAAKKDRIAPWMVDRLYRHLLTDLTGNTHRAEFCIDKLYSPDGPTGRLGLVEFRGFEMPPHPRMALAQSLLIRALITRFWKTPADATALPRWGTTLHDRFCLPHYVEQDFAAVLADLNAHGYAFDPAWYDAFFEFRYPRLGTATSDGVTIELRQAIEPWLTLGEESTSGGQARYVDSSVERLQIKVTGLTREGAGFRHVVTVNGRQVPLTPTAQAGTAIAGVKYRAWQPWSCLHPTIPIHAPLTVELIDPETKTVMTGCTWHVTHPGGRSYDTFPVNALEAESRRNNRFQTHRADADRDYLYEADAPSPEHPITLDLRRPASGPKVGRGAMGSG